MMKARLFQQPPAAWISGLFLIASVASSLVAQEMKPSPVNAWQGNYEGTCADSREGRPAQDEPLLLSIGLAASRESRLVSAFFKDQKRGFRINIPKELEDRDKIKITDEEIVISPTVVCPYEFCIRVAKGPFGESVLKGTYKWFKVAGDGEAVVKNEGTFIVGRVK